MTKLNQLLAIEKGVAGAAARALTDAYQLAQKSAVFTGLNRVYTPKDDDGDRLPSESTRVQQTVTGLVRSVTPRLAAWLNVEWEKDTANTRAKADVVVDGATLVADAPVTYLLWLEKRLIDLRTFVEKWPTLDPAEVWAPEPITGLYATPAQETTRSQKVMKALVLYPATDKHPAQTKEYTVDVPVGTWATTKLSGAVAQSEKNAALDRVEKLLAAARAAREAANSIDVTTDAAEPGRAITDYVFGA